MFAALTTPAGDRLLVLLCFGLVSYALWWQLKHSPPDDRHRRRYLWSLYFTLFMIALSLISWGYLHMQSLTP
ncbi:MAG: hypothetical protein QHH05_01930 [Syntrophomonadaceae bacterium]|nr:hypothetical protein [Syntrophomonadaceae bacterium]MDH7497195.1 hypothetical protein [Syntrophomonadaceae bacterium]